MTDAIRHRGPDDAGHWLDADAGIALGHRRLSILDLSPAGHQPMVSASGRHVIVFNGEIYNHRDLRRELEALGAAAQWRGHSDTEVLLAALDHWGLEDTLGRLNGMFAFALWDRAGRRLSLARDRMGEKPLYYGRFGDIMLFGSELKALQAHPAFRGEIDRGALALYLRHNYIPTPYSIWRGIKKLPPAHYLVIDGRSGGLPAPQAYWDFDRIAREGAAAPRPAGKELVDELEVLLIDAVGRRMEADVPLGAFLSGGIDSSAVVALMQAQSSRPVRTFSIGFHEQGYDEAVHAKAVAAHLGTEHTELYVTPEVALAVIPKIPAIWDEPFSDSSQIPTFLVSEMTKRHVTVSLSGDGGDELFGGYGRYFKAEKFWRTMSRIPTPLRSLLAAATRSHMAKGAGLIVDRIFDQCARPIHLADRLPKLAGLFDHRSPESVYLHFVSHWNNPAALVCGGSEPATLLAEGGPGFSDFRQTMMYLDTLTYLPDDILAKVDRASMAVSLEARVPFLDHRVVEFAWSLPMSTKIRGSTGKHILREVLYRHVPKALLDRPKMGFGVPIEDWLRGPLRDWAEALLDERRLRDEGFFDPAPIRRLWREHQTGQRRWHYYLWDVLMFQSWWEKQKG
ncbi:MAG: asparagine synthase (glutamine-hydrolyzing) [Rhodothalassiaceae bacterium]